MENFLRNQCLKEFVYLMILVDPPKMQVGDFRKSLNKNGLWEDAQWHPALFFCDFVWSAEKASPDRNSQQLILCPQ